MNVWDLPSRVARLERAIIDAVSDSSGSLRQTTLVIRSTYQFAVPLKARRVPGPDGKRHMTVGFDTQSRRGAFRIWLDGRPVGLVRPTQQTSREIAPGNHSVRVQLWWFLSPSVAFTADEGQTVTFTTTVPDTFRLRGFLRLAFHPFRSLLLERIAS